MYISFGEPESILKSNLFDYAECSLFDGLYLPPIPLVGLMKSFRSNAIHGSAIYAKRNMVSLSSELTGLLSREDYNKFLMDRFIFGNGYLLAIKNTLGRVIRYEHLPAMYMYRGEKPGTYSWKTLKERIDYTSGSVFHAKEYDPSQEIYGVPEYFGVLSSVLLNEDATLFRRRYYKNGMHAGFLLYMNNPNMTDRQERDIIEKINSGKGIGNFKNLFINGKGKDKEKPELIPVGEISAKDEFLNMKKVTRDDILSAHRVPISLMSVVIEGLNVGGDLNKVDWVFYKNEIVPIVQSLEALNDHAGAKVVSIKPYDGGAPLLAP